jgi:NitT/TauT family transport system ATP-binding protein
MRLLCEDLSVSFASGRRSACALRHLSFETREGEFLTLLGPSGCGKTTLLRTLAGALHPEAGSIARVAAPSDRNQDVLLVRQEHSLFPWMNTMDNAAFGLEMRGVPRRARERRALELLTRLGLGGREHLYPYQLSLGMKQRVAVARCFLVDPAVILMDEPFAALDCQTRLVLQQELLDLWEQSRKTVIFVTHDVDEAILLSDRILVLSAQPGHVIAEFRVSFLRPRIAGLTLTQDFLFLKQRIATQFALCANQAEAQEEAEHR